MSLDVFERSVTVALEARVRTLNFFGGEPLLNNHFSYMLRTALEKGFYIILATNCLPLAIEDRFVEFLSTTRGRQDRIVIVTARDKFHLKFFDPADIINKLKSHNYQVTVNDYADHTILLSEYNADNPDLNGLNTGFSCCEGTWKDYLGVLPNGAWTICPTSLEPFGDIFSASFSSVLSFKRGLPLRYDKGCTRCLKDFKGFRRIFENKFRNW